MNNVNVLVRLTRDPEVRGEGDSVVSFSGAHNERYKGKDGEMKEVVSFIDFTAFNGTGKFIAQYFKKGSRILISGRLKQDSWEDAEGNKRSKLGVIVREAFFVDGKASEEASSTPAPAQSTGKSRGRPAGKTAGKPAAKQDAPVAAGNFDDLDGVNLDDVQL